jgi:hypothetical protein
LISLMIRMRQKLSRLLFYRQYSKVAAEVEQSLLL